MCYSLEKEILIVNTDENEYSIENDILKSIYFRAPVFLRSFKSYSIEEQLHKSQWSSFIRNLIVFDKAKWVNHPVSTYQAENKAFQLKTARNIGLSIPITSIGNSIDLACNNTSDYIIKSLDTALFYEDNKEFFTYSTRVDKGELRRLSLSEAPVIIQNYLNPKTDLRVTYVNGKCFPISITIDHKGIIGDWRKNKKEILEYNKVIIPSKVINQLKLLMQTLGLEFGGIDLAIVGDTYYFIEVNPTGEWGWVEANTDYSIAKEIVDALQK